MWTFYISSFCYCLMNFLVLYRQRRMKQRILFRCVLYRLYVLYIKHNILLKKNTISPLSISFVQVFHYMLSHNFNSNDITLILKKNYAIQVALFSFIWLAQLIHIAVYVKTKTTAKKLINRLHFLQFAQFTQNCLKHPNKDNLECICMTKKYVTKQNFHERIDKET